MEPAVAEFYENTLRAAPEVSPKTIANWITGDLFGLLNQAGLALEDAKISPQNLAQLVQLVVRGTINQNTGKTVLAEMLTSGKDAQTLVTEKGLGQISDTGAISGLVQKVLDDNPGPVAGYLAGKENLAKWLFGQVMRAAQGRANPQVIQQELDRQLNEKRR
jgi:aspartyl-tRNA(Asn)/glutamyl-tRNA(Gln) amidotransferase subunit B